MSMRYSFGGDEHIFVEVAEEMSLEAFFKSLSITNAVRDSRIRGVTEICPANASYQVKFDPDVIKPDDMLAELKRLDSAAGKSGPVIATRIIEIPVFYDDPWTNETLMRFRERSLDGNGSGWDAYLRYSALTIKLIKAVGGTIIWTGNAEAVALGVPERHRWDYIALVRYPSRAAFLAMMNSPEYATANVERENGCADHAIVAMRETYRKFA